MTIGISKEDLQRIIDHTPYLDISELLNECQDLDPWLPIESAPKDRTLLGLVDGKTRLIRWGKTSHVPIYGFCLADQGAEDFDICNPTHYRLLPQDPKE